MNIERLCPGCMNDNGGEKICSICGYDMSGQNDRFCLPVRFLLSERYVIGKAVSVNAEGIIYIALDNATDTVVHIKEYYPKGIAVRNPDKTVSVVASREFYFNEGLMNFIEINRKLIETELQAIVPVLSVFEENGTVYSVLPVISGVSLNAFLDRNGGNIPWEQARSLFLPLIDTIKGLHEIGIIHGGISPDTIILGKDGKLRLIALYIPRLRMVSQDCPAELYNGYAAVEQYGKLETGLGTASDVYALSAVLFRVLIGIVPPSSEVRLMGDTLSIPSKFADELPRQVLVAIANGMQIKVQKRTKDIDSFKNELVYGETQENMRRVAAVRTAEANPKQDVAKQQQSAQKKGNSVKYAVIAAVITAVLFLVAALLLWQFVLKDKFTSDNSSSSQINSGITSVPSESEEDPGSEIPSNVKTYAVPNLLGKTYSQLISNSEEGGVDYSIFTYKIKNKEYSDDYARGTVCVQSISAGEKKERGTEILLTISLGPETFKLTDFVNGTDAEGKPYTVQSAKLELLEQGFLPENIIVKEMQKPDEEYGIIVKQSPSASAYVSADDAITIYYNVSNKPEEPDGNGSTSTGAEESE